MSKRELARVVVDAKFWILDEAFEGLAMTTQVSEGASNRRAVLVEDRFLFQRPVVQMIEHDARVDFTDRKPLGARRVPNPSLDFEELVDVADRDERAPAVDADALVEVTPRVDQQPTSLGPSSKSAS